MRIKPNEPALLELNERERELILSQTLADESLTDRLRVVPKRDERPFFASPWMSWMNLPAVLPPKRTTQRTRSYGSCWTSSSLEFRILWQPTLWSFQLIRPGGLGPTRGLALLLEAFQVFHQLRFILPPFVTAWS